MDKSAFLQLFSSETLTDLKKALFSTNTSKIRIEGLHGSAKALIPALCYEKKQNIALFVISDREDAAYFYNDLENLLDEKDTAYEEKKVYFFPATFNKYYDAEKIDNANVLMRTELLSLIHGVKKDCCIVTYPEAILEKVVSKTTLSKNSLKINKNDHINIDFIAEYLTEYEFERVDFVVEPGQFSVRGGIVDIFSFAVAHPFRIELYDDKVESIRSFDITTQLSLEIKDSIQIIPNLNEKISVEKRLSLIDALDSNAVIWIDNFHFIFHKLEDGFQKASEIFASLTGEIKHLSPEELFLNEKEFANSLVQKRVVEFTKGYFFNDALKFIFKSSPQPVFNKNFDLLAEHLIENQQKGYKTLLLSNNPKQVERLSCIMDDILSKLNKPEEGYFQNLDITLHEGFVFHDNKIACFTDHQIFERYHKFKINERYAKSEAITIKELNELKPGDYVTHIDHGIGRFAGLEKIIVNGKEQEAIRIVYKDNDVLHISIHSLHRISKYAGKDGTPPTLHRLGSNAWNTLKSKTKQKVKDIASDLIKLYAERKTKKGYSFSPDNYLQYELEASFLYEDTPDQLKAINEVKKDMQESYPMDRLICGDVGFGKTEVAIRAAFKAVCDSKQVAVLVPTTILALQHYKTFTERLENLPCNVDYINRFKKPKAQKETIQKLKEGKIDIIIGTHRLLGKDIEFKDLGLLIIDEEQKFGVAAKEKLKKLKINVDSLTLTATPIPRTLQFSLMGARDLSIISTPPPNRFPIHTELHVFNENIIRDAIMYEMNRGGQIFFVNNKISNIQEIAGLIQKLVPEARIAIGHGQLDGEKLEEIMLDFIDEQYDVLVATTIIESGLDIPNANTIIINEAHMYGLSDLHQMRGRVGRTNKKAFCYLLTPPFTLLTDEARRRLKAIEEFADLGSGFNIAMRDLDIRGAGNLLGGEQSGFIAEIGFEMYHKILDEAIQELKENEFKSFFASEKSQEYVKECVLETDLPLLLPNEYITNTTERLNLYKELNALYNVDELKAFTKKLNDRFGPLPTPTIELIKSMELRKLAKDIGFEKLILRNNQMIAFFISNQNAEYYQSEQFAHVLNCIKQNPKAIRLKEGKDKLALIFEHVVSIQDAMQKLQAFLWEG